MIYTDPDYSRKAKVWVVVATHKKYPMPKDKMYIPLHVGAEGKKDENGMPLDLGFQTDNTGDNISSMNDQFCELTGLYWAWKNLKSDYLGLVHYRRHFKGLSQKAFRKKKAGNIDTEEYKDANNAIDMDSFDRVLKYKELRPLLDKYKIFVPKKRHYYIETLQQHYAHNHRIIELDTARDIIKEKYPEYMPAYDTAINRTWGYMFNMMIMRRDLMEEYLTWLFDILFELKSRLESEDGLSSFENRYPGRVSERIFNVWLTYQMQEGKIREDDICEIPFMYMEKINILNKGITFLKAKFIGKKPEKSF